jgi:four helix bundle protein
MFDFEKLEVYQIARVLNRKVLTHLYSNKNLDPFIKEQWKRATLSIVLNLAEGTGRMTNADKKHFYTISRGSVFECVALLETVHDLEYIDIEKFKDFYAGYEQVSKMLLAMFRSFDK